MPSRRERTSPARRSVLGLNTTGHEIGGSLGIAVLVTIATGAIGTGASTAGLANGLGDAFLVSG